MRQLLQAGRPLLHRRAFAIPPVGLFVLAGLLVLTSPGGSAACAQTAVQPASVRSLETRIGDNVFVVPDKAAKSITGWLIVRAGCADEAGGQCEGIAHYLEHLLFINRDSDNRSKVSLFPDGAGNGWTTHRATAYYQRFPVRPGSDSANLDKLVGFFAGLLNDVRAEDAQAERERNVVLQEYQQNTGRNPFARFQVDLARLLMPNDPLGQRVIGSPATIAKFTAAAARDFHSRWYARNNAVLILHGPIEARDAEAAIDRHFKPLPEKTIPANAWKAPQRYALESNVLQAVDKDARQTAIYLDRIVTFDEPSGERAQNDAANAIISGYLASRLANSPAEILVERDGIATDARLSIGRVRDGAFRISFFAVPAAKIDPQAVLAAARSYIAEFTQRGLPPEIVARLKMRITNERALMREQPSQYAQVLTSWFSAHGSYEDWNLRLSQHDALTAGQVNRLLGRFAAVGREVAGILAPVVPPAGASPIPSAADLAPNPEPSSAR